MAAAPTTYRSNPEVSQHHEYRFVLHYDWINLPQSEKQRGSSLRDIVLKTRHAKLASGNSPSTQVARASSVPLSGDRYT